MYESISGTFKACDDTSSASARALTRFSFGVLVPDSYCAMRTSAVLLSRPTFIPRTFCVMPRRFRINRIRSPIAFRVSLEKDEQIETAVLLSGLTKQDYIIRRLQRRDVVVVGNPRAYKALRNQLAAVLTELQRINAGATVNSELLDTIRLIAISMDGMKEDR